MGEPFDRASTLRRLQRAIRLFARSVTWLGVESDEIVADEGDGEQHARGDESGHVEEPAVDVEGSESGWRRWSLDETPALEREREPSTQFMPAGPVCTTRRVLCRSTVSVMSRPRRGGASRVPLARM